MRKLVLTSIILICLNCYSNAQNRQVFYYYNDKKIVFQPCYDILFVTFTNTKNFENGKQFQFFYKDELKEIDKNIDLHKPSNAIRFRINKTKLNSEKKILEFISILKKRNDVDAVYPGYITSNDTVYVSNRIMLMLKGERDYKLLKQRLKSYDGEIVETFNMGTLNQYEVSIGKSYNVFDVSNALKESKIVKFSQPNFTHKAFTNYTPNDTYYSSQYFLNQIDAPDAWNITKGNSNVVIAVMDGNGFDLNHPDMVSKFIYPYDPAHDTYNPIPENDYANHGTPCAGLIGALTDNSLGVASVGFNIKVMPICIGNMAKSDGTFYTDDAIIAKAASWIISHSDVYAVSNSWADPYPSESEKSSFNSITTNARNGKGAVVFAATGNDGHNNVIAYPASYNSVIGVGASDATDHRAAFSNYGDIVDIVAPGYDLYTIDRSGSYGEYSGDYGLFNGTSAACPVAAAIVGLLASKDPTQTASSYTDAILKSCEKVGGYTYTSGFPYGSRNNEMGYGRVNAYKALMFNSSCSTPSNNTCPTATQLTISSTCSYINGSSCGATNSNFGASCLNENVDDDVFYRFTATGTSTTVKVQGLDDYDAAFKLPLVLVVVI